MNSTKSSHTRRIELILSYVLRYGVIISSIVIASGLIAQWIQIGNGSQSSGQILSEIVQGKLLKSYQPIHLPSQFWEGIFHFTPDTITALGLLLLITLPILRVGMTVILFLAEKDWIYFGITLLVFSVLLFGMLYGHKI